MATSTLRRDGSDTLFYVSDTAPTAVDDETDAAYDLVGMVQSHTLPETAASTFAEDKDGGTFLRSNTVQRSATLSCHLARNDDDGQVVLDTAMASGAEIYCLIMPTTTGHKGRSFTAVVTDSEESSANGAAETRTYSLGLTSTPAAATKA